MPATKRLVLDLPADQVDEIEARVAAGEFESASALVLALLEGQFAIDEVDSGSEAFKAWLREGDEVVARLRAGTEPTYTADEVRARLKAARDAREEVERLDRRKRA